MWVFIIIHPIIVLVEREAIALPSIMHHISHLSIWTVDDGVLSVCTSQGRSIHHHGHDFSLIIIIIIDHHHYI